MRRLYSAYLLLSVLPSLAAVVAGVIVSRHAWAELRTASSSWVGTVALNAFQEDLARAVDSLAAAAVPTPVHPDDPAWDRVSQGGRVSGLRPRGSSAEVMVLTGPGPGDPPGSLRYASAPLPTAPVAVAQAMESRLTFYLNGRRVLETGDSPGPDTLPRQTLLALSAARAGLALTDGTGGAMVALDHPPGLPPSVVVTVGPSTRPGAIPPPPLLLVVGLLFLTAGLAGRTLMRAPRGGSQRGRWSMVVVALVPVLTALGFLVQADRLFRGAERTESINELRRTLAVADARRVGSSPDRIRDLTGFHATLVDGGRIEKTTLAEPSAQLAALPPPPPSSTSSGVVDTPAGPSLFVARQLEGGALLVVSHLRADHGSRAFRRTMLTVGGVLVAWLLAGGWMAGIGARRSGDAPG